MTPQEIATRKQLNKIMGLDENEGITEVAPIKAFTDANKNNLNKATAQVASKELTGDVNQYTGNDPLYLRNTPDAKVAPVVQAAPAQSYGLVKDVKNVGAATGNKVGQYADATVETGQDIANTAANLRGNYQALGSYLTGNTDMQSQAAQDAMFAGKYQPNTPQARTLAAAADSGLAQYKPAQPDLSNPPVNVNVPNVDRTAQIAAAEQAARVAQQAKALGVTVGPNGVPIVDNTVAASEARKKAGITDDMLMSRGNAGGFSSSPEQAQQNILLAQQSDLNIQRQMLASDIREQQRILNSDYNVGAKREAMKKLEILKGLSGEVAKSQDPLLQAQQAAGIAQKTAAAKVENDKAVADQAFKQQQILEQLKAKLDPKNDLERQKLANQQKLTDDMIKLGEMEEGPEKEAFAKKISLFGAAIGNTAMTKNTPPEEYVTNVVKDTREVTGEKITTSKVIATNKRTGEVKDDSGPSADLIASYQQKEAEINAIKNAKERTQQLAFLNDQIRKNGITY